MSLSPESRPPMRRLLTAMVALSAAVALASCTDPTAQPPEPIETETVEASDDEATTDSEPDVDPQFSESDVTHAQQFIVLHRTSLELHEIIRSKADMVDDVATLSLGLYTTHYDQIEELEQMLTAWGEAVPETDAEPDPGEESDTGEDAEGGGDEADDEGADDGSGDDGSAGGDARQPVSDEDIRELGRASGDAANAMYLEQMIALHQARSSIAEDTILEGENTDLVDLAQTMLTSQEHEVTLMREIIAGLDLPDDEDTDDDTDDD